MTSDRLLAALLAGQPQPEPPLDAERFVDDVHSHLSRGADLPADLTALIWLRPDARRLYAEVRHDLARSFAQRWQSRGGALTVERLAASGETPDQDSAPEEIRARGFTVTTHLDRTSGRWLISLVLEPEMAGELPQGLAVELRDSGDLLWLRGRLDRLGGLDAWWPHDGNPRRRLTIHQLQLAFI